MAGSDKTTETYTYVLYHYTPTLIGSIAALVIFSILTGLHLWRLIRHKAHYFIAFTIGGIFQIVGYGLRTWSHFDPKSIMPFAMQNGYILLAPALYAASMYMILGRLIRACHAHHLSPIPVSWVTRVLVGGDVISFTIQASGGSMAMGGFSLLKISRIVVILGLFVQVIIFGFFVYVSTLVHRRLLKSPTEIVQEDAIPWKRYFHILYATSGIILVRSIFRIIEYIEGNDGFLISHEAFLYVFDAILMAVVMAIFLVWYVDSLQCKEEKNELASDGNRRDLELAK
ncbi:hypothetical protein FOQG_16609 [Fusarium oxysporum f. sp. raphani 54005]|uniref:Protein RTA1 n=2 Tax=Fusarium oxysporum f. sp. raphani TaxID=96318 RepID=X0BAF7_FUSOX|nr:hypothetical protein FOQG_16609 [Fusarium oxysporum f. sp. raphani 54005]KAG7437029.1 Protein RTA1 [Fusarium oxysporum f. sp. raphani]